MNEIKSQFSTREGAYKLLTHSEYSRPNRVPFNSQGSNPVRVSFVNVNDQSGNGDRICFNVGRELYFYIYKGVRKVRTTRVCLQLFVESLLFHIISDGGVNVTRTHTRTSALSLLTRVCLFICACVALTGVCLLLICCEQFM